MNLKIPLAIVAIWLFLQSKTHLTDTAFTNISIVIGVIVVLNIITLMLWRLRSRFLRLGMADIDAMEGKEFEEACAELLRNLGYKKVTVTKTSGDQGVDILAVKGKIRYAVQCKRHDGSVGNAAIQEVAAGIPYYGCDQGIVITNSYFTESAIRLAMSNNIDLWDRDFLTEHLRDFPK